MEKAKQESNCIKELITDKGIIDKTEDILDHAYNFYSKLYQAEDLDISKQDDLLNLIEDVLSEEDKTLLDSNITEDELYAALNAMKRRKSPRNDGLTVEFYVHFWNILKPIFVHIVNHIFSEKQLSRSMKKGVISLFYKKRGDKRDIRNFRPISLLNVDCKLISKVLASRLKHILGSVISPEQTCGIPGRDIADNIHSLRDIIDLSNNFDETYIVTIDQEKAFDRVSQAFIIKILEKMNFGDYFISWIKILYSGLLSSVKVNGHLTPYFPITRSVRQGDPLSSLLFVIVSQSLNQLIKANQDIHPIVIDVNHQSLLHQHADDATVTVCDKQSVIATFKSLDYYCSATGAKINLSKSEVLALGRLNQNIVPNFDLPITIKRDCLKILGIFLGVDKLACENKNWKSKLNKIKSLLGLWSQRHLTLQGKSIVVNTFILSKLWYSIYVLPVPEWFISEIERCISNFIWSGKTPCIKRTTTIGHFMEGGLSLPSLKFKIYSFRLKIVNKLFDSNYIALWKHSAMLFFQKYLNMGLNKNIFNIIYNEVNLKEINPFYAEVLRAWDEITCSQRELVTNPEHIMHQPLFHNPHVRFQGKVLDFKFFIDCGISTLADICYEVVPGFLKASAITEIVFNHKSDVPVSHIRCAFFIIIKSLPKEWFQHICSYSTITKALKELTIISDDGNYQSNQLTVKFCYSCFVTKSFVKPTSIAFWDEYCLDIDWSRIWKIVFHKDKSQEHRDLDFRICHNIVYTNLKMFRYGKSDNNMCPVCQDDIEDMFHMFVFCDELYDTISIFRDLFTNVFREKGFSLNDLISWLLFGFHSTKAGENYDCINILLSIYRLCVYKRRAISSIENKTVNMKIFFKNSVKLFFKILWFHYRKNGQSTDFLNTYVFPLNIIAIGKNEEIILKHPLV